MCRLRDKEGKSYLMEIADEKMCVYNENQKIRL